MKQLCQFRKPGTRFLLSIIAFIFSLLASAQSYFQKPVTLSRRIELVKAFNEVEVLGDVTIILTNNLEGKVLFHGDPKDVRFAKATIKNKKLIIDANNKRSFSKMTVYLPASGFNSLITSGKTEILSSGTIKVHDLEILLNGSSLVSINYDGKLRVTPGTGYELEYARN